MAENKKYTIFFLVLLQICFLIYLGYSFYKEYEYNKNLYTIENLQEKYKNKLQELEKEKENILLNIKSENKVENKPLLTLFEQNEEIEEKLKQEYLAYLEERKNYLKKETEVSGKDLLLSIPSINLKIKSIPLKTDSLEEIHKKLEEGVIRYSLKDILEYGVTTIYGHSSQPLHTYVDYSYFKKIPFINVSDKVEFINEKENKKYNYKVIKSFEINTEDLQKKIEEYDKKWLENIKKYVFLITCYPINTTKKRWLIILENQDV